MVLARRFDRVVVRHTDSLRQQVHSLRALGFAAMLVVTTGSVATGQETEIGASLASLTIGTGDNNTNTFGIPTGGFGILSPSVYASIFVHPQMSVEPQLGLMWVSDSGESFHILNLAG